jgi:cytochrome c5
LAFDKNGNAFVKLMGTIQIANAGRLWRIGSAAKPVNQSDRDCIMKRILTLSIAIMAVSALSAGAADAKTTYEKDCAKCHGADGKGETKMGKK